MTDESTVDEILEAGRTNNQTHLLPIEAISDEEMGATLWRRGGRNDARTGGPEP